MSSQRRALPPLSSQQTLESDDYSDFPPIRILKSPEITLESAPDDYSDFPPIRVLKTPEITLESASDDHSDFPPIRILKTPDPSSSPCSPVSQRRSEFRRRHPPSVAQRRSEQLSSPRKEPAPSRSRRHSKNSSKSSLKRDADVLEVEDERPSKKKRVASTSKNTSKSSLKRDADVLEVEDERPSKKKRVAFTNKGVAKNTSNPSLKRDAVALTDKDMDWLKHEISDIKGCVKAIAEHLKANAEYRLEERRWTSKNGLDP